MRKVLVIRLSSLGDVVLTGPVFQALRAAWPDAKLTMLTKEEFGDVLLGHPCVDSQILFRRGESLRSLIRRVRREHFEVLIDLHANVRSHVISLFSRIPRRARYRKAALARRLYVRWRWPSADLQMHTLDRYRQALKALGIETPQTFAEGAGRSRNYLVIQTAYLGDAVLTLPFLKALRDHDPQAQITVLATPEIAEVFERHPAVSEVLTFDKRGRDRSWRALWRLAQKLRAQHYHAAFLPHRSFRSALLAWAAGIPRRIGYSSSQGRWLLTDVVPFQWGVHDADRNLALLKALGVQKASGELWIQPEKQSQERIQEKFLQAGIAPDDFLLGVNAGSLWPTKRWLPEGFAAVADRAIRELGARVVFFGTPADRSAVDAILAAMQEKAVDWVGRTDLLHLIAAIARCNLFLTNDSGPMHIAVACRVPAVAIFGPTTRELGFFPYGTGHAVVEKELPCRPCGLHGAKKCPLGHFECMKLITPEDVFEAVARLAAKSRSDQLQTLETGVAG